MWTCKIKLSMFVKIHPQLDGLIIWAFQLPIAQGWLTLESNISFCKYNRIFIATFELLAGEIWTLRWILKHWANKFPFENRLWNILQDYIICSKGMKLHKSWLHDFSAGFLNIIHGQSGTNVVMWTTKALSMQVLLGLYHEIEWRGSVVDNWKLTGKLVDASCGVTSWVVFGWANCAGRHLCIAGI